MSADRPKRHSNSDRGDTTSALDPPAHPGPPTPRVTVVVPAFNVAHCLGECIDSVLAQSFQPLQIIIVNDGSTDDTASVARHYGDRVELLRQENSGQGAARNLGITRAKGEYLAFLDADDFWKPDFVDRCVRFLDDNPSAVAVNTAFQVRLPDGTEYGRPILEPQDQHSKPQLLSNFMQFWAAYDHVRTGTCLMRTKTVRECGGQLEDLRVSQDLEFWGYLSTRGAWGFIPTAHWVGNSRAASARSGLWRKYSHRRRLCPTVKQWSRRLEPAVHPNDREYYLIVKGRVAAGFINNYVFAGEHKKAQSTFDEFRGLLPPTRPVRLLRLLRLLGRPGWTIACWMLTAREAVRSAVLRRRYATQNLDR